MIPEITKILFATDLSENSSTYVFSYAVDMATRHGAGIVILHTIEPHHSLAYAGEGVEAVMRNARKGEQDSSREEIKKRIEAFCEKAEAHIGAVCVELVSKILVPIGRPVDEILKTAKSEGCDVLVIGAHQKGFLSKAFLGDVACSVLEASRKPVFVIPMPSEEAYASQIKI